MENLQALCIECHSEKTKNELEQGYKIRDNTKSLFNPIVEKENRSKHWAFIQKSDGIKSKDTKHIDINKCRRNIIVNNKFDYPIYSVINDF